MAAATVVASICHNIKRFISKVKERKRSHFVEFVWIGCFVCEHLEFCIWKSKSPVNLNPKKEQMVTKDVQVANIAAQTFTFCELAATTK